MTREHNPKPIYVPMPARHPAERTIPAEPFVLPQPAPALPAPTPDRAIPSRVPEPALVPTHGRREVYLE